MPAKLVGTDLTTTPALGRHLKDRAISLTGACPAECCRSVDVTLAVQGYTIIRAVTIESPLEAVQYGFLPFAAFRGDQFEHYTASVAD